MEVIMKNIEVGQVLYVVTREMFLSGDAEIEEFEVSKVNTASVYVKKKNSGFEIRLNRKSLIGRSMLGGYYKGYLDRDTYIKEVEDRETIKSLKCSIKLLIDDMSLDQLNMINSYCEGMHNS